MPFIPVVNCVRSSVIYDLNGQMAINTLSFKFATPPGVSDMAALNTALHTWWTSHLKPTVDADVALTRIITVDLASSIAPSADLIISPSEPGTLTATVGTPANAAIVMTIRTANRGRNYRGRTYVPGLSGNGLTSNVSYNLTSVANIINAFTWLLTNTNIANFTWGVISRYLNKSPRGTGIFTPATAVSADQYIDSSRRRLFGRGA